MFHSRKVYLQKASVRGMFASYNVLVQGDLENRAEKAFFLTLHDIGEDRKHIFNRS